MSEQKLLKLIFPKSEYLWHLNRTDIQENVEKLIRDVYKNLFERLGVNKSEGGQIIIFAVLPHDTSRAVSEVMTLLEECEQKYRKRVDMDLIRIEAFTSPEAASKSPLLEQASFIYFPDQDEPGIENYPYLEKLLPFLVE